MIDSTWYELNILSLEQRDEKRPVTEMVAGLGYRLTSRQGVQFVSIVAIIVKTF